MAGGGPLMDIGIYSLNAARFVTGEEPVEVTAKIEQPADDPRFKEVEAAMDFTLTFPGGAGRRAARRTTRLLGTSFRVIGERGWINLTPAFMYGGNLMSMSRDGGSADRVAQPPVEPLRRGDGRLLAVHRRERAARARPARRACGT